MHSVAAQLSLALILRDEGPLLHGVRVELLNLGLQVRAEGDERPLVGLRPAVAARAENCDEPAVVQHLVPLRHALVRAHAERDELLLRIFRHCVLGGGMCQYEDMVQPYFEVSKKLYKGLLAVRKHEETGKIEILTEVFSLKSVRASDRGAPSLFPGRSPYRPQLLSLFLSLCASVPRCLCFFASVLLPLCFCFLVCFFCHVSVGSFPTQHVLAAGDRR